METPELFQRYLADLEKELTLAIGDSPLPLYSMMRYHMGWEDSSGNPQKDVAGKRLRPTLCLLSCEAVGSDYKCFLPAAASIELLHNFSLIHDDIQDGSVERRHRPTVWWIWGPAQGINAGDGMHTLARLHILKLADAGVPCEKVLRAAALLDTACLRLCEGQFLDINYQYRMDVSVDDYFRMVDGKTAALMSCSLEMGAMLGTDDERVVSLMSRCGQMLGLAYQVIDDALGLWGGSGIGKEVGSDIRNKKKTLPVIYGLERAEGKDRDVLLTFYRGKLVADEDVQKVVEILERLGAREFSKEKAESYHRQAIAAIEETGISRPAMEELKKAIAFLANRKY
ncbi:MAG: polyprenyl synthetase family protein [Chloroflexi bacterium]|nr:polyprenyl synthetase family protein [Chloroflexota bacterium]